MRAKGILYTALAAMIYGFVPVFASLSYLWGNNPNNMAFFRSFLALPFLIFFIWKEKLSVRLNKVNLIQLIVIGIMGSGLTTILLYQSYCFIGVGTATAIHFFYPLLVCFYCRIFFGERIRMSRLICLSVCMTGILVMLDWRDLNNIKGIAMAFGSAVTYAFYMTFLGKTGLTKIHPVVFALYMSLIVSVLMLALNIPMDFITVRLPFRAYGAMFIVATGMSMIGSILLNRGVAVIGAAESSIFSLLEPITSIAAGIIVLGEPFGIRNAAGCLLIFAPIVCMIVLERKACIK